MNRKTTFSKVVVLVISMAFLVSAFATLPAGNIIVSMTEEGADGTYDAPYATGTRAGSQRTVLVELFTQWNCGPCASANPALNELLDEYGQSQLVMIATHAWWPSPDDDPFYQDNVPDSQARINYYSVTGVPTAIFDGTDASGSGDQYSRYNSYKSTINSRLMVSSPLEVNLEGYHNSTQGWINVTIQATDIIPSGTNKIKFVVTEDNRFGPGANGEVRHRQVMRDQLANEDLPLLSIGQQFSVSRTFPIDQWMYSIDNLGIVVYVQNEDDDEVFNSAYYDYVPQKILVVDDDVSTNPAGGEDDYHELLCMNNLAFDGWVGNQMGSPTLADLQKYETVIWVTGSQSSNTITLGDQTTISNYLDTTTGSLLIAGENLGQDIGASPFYSDYLHASYVFDNSGETTIAGIFGDPISDKFSSKTFSIVTSSPDDISPVSPAALTFLYGGGQGAAVRAEHDADSRVVYFGCLFFEGTQAMNDRRSVLEKVLTWLGQKPVAIDLVEGYNLISIPNTQFDSSIGSVFDPIAGKYDAVQWYDNSDPSDPWKHWMGSKPGGMNDLSQVDNTMGVWLKVTEPGSTMFMCNGSEPSVNVDIQLNPGWNLVGYPSLTDRSRDAALNNVNYPTHVDGVWTFDAKTDQWISLSGSDSFEMGRGYMVHSLTTITWNVPL